MKLLSGAFASAGAPKASAGADAVPTDAAGVEDVAGGRGEAVVLGHAIEERPGDVGGQRAGLGGAIVELGNLQVAVAAAQDGLSRADAQGRVAGPIIGSG